MNIKPLTVVTSLAVVIAVATPVGLSAYLTRQNIIRSEKDRALGYAVDVLARSEAVTDQIDSGIKRLVDSGISDPCSVSSQALMRQIDLSSSYIQAIGYVAGNRMICSSLGTEIGGLELGPVDIDRASEVKRWLNVEFPL